MKRIRASLAHRARQIWWRVRKPQTLGVKVLVRNPSGEVLLVKPVYANNWQIPGGGVEKFEHPLQAGMREIREETGIRLLEHDMTLVNVFMSRHEGKSDCVIYFEASCNDISPKADGVEVDQARFYDQSSLPQDTSPSVRRRLRGESIDGFW